MNADTTTCITCGTPITAEVLGGKCPTCLKKVALAEPTLPGDTMMASRLSRRQAAWEPPSVEEVAALLPRGFYTVESFIGRGGMGAVYKGTQTVLKRPVAIKIMRQDQAVDAEFRLRFLREAQMLARLSHPGIVNVIDCGEAGPDFLFIVMEFVDGANLMDVIRSGGVSEARALTIMKQVCEALQFAHTLGIVHRDIKPSNIILMRDGRIKLADFGLATQLEPEDGVESDADGVAGTPAYAAPEQFAAGQAVDQRADIYALGVMIYQMLTGELPRGDWKPPSQTVAVDPAWDKIITQALQPLPQDRLSAAEAMQQMLSRIAPLGGEQIRRRHTRLVWAAVALGALVAGGYIVWDWNERRSDYPMPKQWVDAMPELFATAEQYRFGQKKEQGLEIRENAHCDLAANREFKDVAMRVTYAGSLSAGLRGTKDEYYFASVLPDGEAQIKIGTTNVIEHPDAKPATIHLGQTYDPTRTHELVFAARGDVMRLWLDGRLLLTLKDNILPSGRLTLRVRPKQDSPVRILRLEYAALGDGSSQAPAGLPEFKPEPGSIIHRLTSPDYKWGAPVNLGPGVNSAADDADPHISPDSLIFTFASARNGLRQFYECRRNSVDEAFGSPQKLPGVTVNWAGAPWITPDRRTLLYISPEGPNHQGASQDIYVMKRADPSKPWGQLANLTTVNSDTHDQSPCLSSDGLTLYFGSLRAAGYGGHDMWRAKRKSIDAPFDDISNLGPTINTFIQERDMFLAADDHTLLFTRMFAEDPMLTSVLHVAVPDERGGYEVRSVDLPVKGMITDPCISSDGSTLWFAWKGPVGHGDRDLWQIQRVPKTARDTTVAHPALASREVPFENSLGMKFVPVPIAGGPTDGKRVLFSVWETRVQDYEVFARETGREWPAAGIPQGPTHPAVQVSWHDAQAFCAWMTVRDRRAGSIGEQDHYRLTSDREWSCAAGIGDLEDPSAVPSKSSPGGPGNRFLWGTGWPPPAGAANYAGEEARSLLGKPEYKALGWIIDGYRDPFLETAPVGSFPANQHGLHDLSGNVWEWCEDWHDQGRNLRVARGSDFLCNSGMGANLTARGSAKPERRWLAHGMRVVLAEAAPSATPPAKPPPARP